MNIIKFYVNNVRIVLVSMLLVFLVAERSNATEHKYKLDNASIDLLIEQCIEIDLNDPKCMKDRSFKIPSNTASFVAAGNSPSMAFILCSFLGFMGAHRIYMGTSPGAALAYISTCGGCLLVAFVDWVLLLIAVFENDISMYQDHPGFFMWY